MYCVVQEVEVKKAPRGEPKELEVYESRWADAGEERCYYEYRYSEECFVRPVKKAYRISIHESYREAGKIRKKQTVICTINYYNVVDYGDWMGDYVKCKGGLKTKADALRLPESELVDMIYKKWQPIADRILAEFEQTAEYKAREEHRRIISEYNKRMGAFVEKYGVDRSEYKRCYDVFGELRNPEYLQKIKAEYEARKEYERKSREQSRSYYENFAGNHGGWGSGSYCGTSSSNYSENERSMLKKFYRTLSKAFHPDSNPDEDTSAEMKMLNQLKSEWGI